MCLSVPEKKTYPQMKKWSLGFVFSSGWFLYKQTNQQNLQLLRFLF